ncbi:hypothetical protein LENED_008312 [Lentinula edodes]|uniref:Uncharacterized protein n=1 Tax=Lentinula edodes TaxID=5353 RepID=A0A1Q3EGN7_LENED|nr:hypothetical protein LENED_008312 [Lentinula edodes]
MIILTLTVRTPFGITVEYLAEFRLLENSHSDSYHDWNYWPQILTHNLTHFRKIRVPNSISRMLISTSSYSVQQWRRR